MGSCRPYNIHHISPEMLAWNRRGGVEVLLSVCLIDTILEMWNAIMSVVNRRQSLKRLLPLLGGCYLFPSSVAWPQTKRPGESADYYPRYVNTASSAGLITKTVIAGDESRDFLLSTTGGGVCVFDYDNDGWLDIFIANGWGLKDFPKGQEPRSRLYRNNRDGTFTDVTEKAGLVQHGWGQGVCAGDYDNDGNLDLFVTSFGHNALFHNNGDGTFTDVTQECGLYGSEPRWGSGAAFVDYNRDGHLDLFVCNYSRYEAGLVLYDASPGLMKSPVLMGVPGFGGGRNILYRNNGNGTFTDVSDAAGILEPLPAYSFTPLVADFDNDGWPDIYVANDSNPGFFFQNNRNGTFSETGLLAGVAFDGNGRSLAGMGADAADYDGDGRLDIVKSNFSNEPPVLYHNEGDGFFEDKTFEAGLGDAMRFVKWGIAFFDFDNDGNPDILIVSGPIYPPGVNAGRVTYDEGGRYLFRNAGDGRFKDISDRAGQGIAEARCGRGLALGDLFHTGQIDAVINNINDSPSLLRNELPSAHSWLLVKLIGTKTNRAAIGSRVILVVGDHRQMQEVRSGGSFCSQSDLRLHFGLGRSRQADRLEVRWLNGGREMFERVPANRLVTIQEGKGIISQDTF